VELTAEAIVELFKGDVRARKELAELLISEPDIRLAIINAVLRDVATKSDIEALRAAVKDDIDKLRESLENRFEQHRAATKSDIESLRKAVEERFERVATKSDVEQLRSEFRREIDFLAREVDRLYRLVMVSVLGILISVATTILVRVLLPP
jgi:molybdopterin converting factor small subunit